MGFPTVLDVDGYDHGEFGLDEIIPVPMPATVAAGDLLLIGVCQALDDDPYEDVEGWAKLFDNEMFNSGQFAWYVKVAEGDEDGTTVNVETLAGNVLPVAIVIRIEAGSWAGTIDDVEAGGYATGTTTTQPSTLEFTPSWGADNNLWICSVGVDDDDPPGVDTFPPLYTGHNLVVINEEAVGAQHCRLAIATKQNAVATEQCTGWVLPSGEQWGAVLIAVRGTDFVPPAAGGIAAAMHSYRQRRLA
jgi:hypothetical protein